jgi:CheY-like chemotaxis protein
MLLHLLTAVFRRRGFAVWTATNGPTAVAAYQEHQDEIDVALLDVRMPGVDGPGTLARLRQINPALRCCFMSGHTGEYTTDHLLACGASHCFDKPFRMDDVAQTLLTLARAS